jgi:nitroreductase
MDIQELEKLVKGRRSVRRWTEKGVPDDVLRKAVELGTWAPNGGNYQGWRFVVVKNRGCIEKIANAVQSVSDTIVSWPEAVGFDPEEIRRYKDNASQWRHAPVLMGVFSRQYQSLMDKLLVLRESFDSEAKKILDFRRSAPTSVQSTAAAVTTILLALHQMGLGAVWLAAPLLAKGEIEHILDAPEGLELVCLIAAGYPAEAPRKDRLPVDQILRFVP